MSECEHRDFEASVTVNRLEDVKQFAADVHITCRDCYRPFQFLGLPGGLHPGYPTVSVDATEARLPIAPMGQVGDGGLRDAIGFRIRAYAPPPPRNHGLFADDTTPGKFEELPAWARQEETGRP